jgi:hypothetical protein
MARINKGILGPISGKVGSVVGGTWKGIDYVRSKQGSRSGPPSPAQLEQQEKFKLVTRFISSLGGLLMFTFKNYAHEMTGANSAMSYTIKNAVVGNYPNYELDYSRVLVSRGDLPNVGNPLATAEAGSKVKFVWTNNAGVGKAMLTDKMIVLVYCPEMNLCIYTTGSTTRSTTQQELDVATFSGKVVHTYVGVTSENGKDIASSFYTGQLTIS